jgi:hypothetical protein
MGIKLVLVHGFRPQVNEQLRSKGHESRFSQGLRITDAIALDSAQEAAGQLRFEIEAAFSQGLPEHADGERHRPRGVGQLPHGAAGRHSRRASISSTAASCAKSMAWRFGARSTSARWCCCRRSAFHRPARPST